ncbi:tRNA preQ1(34) S-adenosylmethionine ribosyltransferase-isomerase QueA [Calditerricola satsumensis]|uniref:S-adenosylmethionine:tRNA ribosyltransferase-isomerase n=1 Tax=Calditerricola satsumensis TaxID=373054 RepID=A0A8J3FBG8_9BACI|nr:tRNA preQ1(34) S-adenosylmethionine ribosyltransferase-isomerase QueA [Calditerricola satsumensis]GGK01618.1 S-adenosylmethionine:tRNA ribosyltransferase-isomerase [Calditerricola satsumensis]
MDIKDYDFDLPEELVAQTPLPDRAESRLLVLHRATGELEHRRFRDVIEYLHPGDTLVLNDTRVMPARLFGVKEGTGAKIEVLLLKDLGDDRWETLVKPGKRVRPGTVVSFGDGLLRGVCEGVTDAGGRIFRFQYEGGDFHAVLERLGEIPLPPYIRAKLDDPERYQTVYAKKTGSAAAPTAGLHFTRELLDAIAAKGVDIATLTLHVGLGTFRPVTTERVEDHRMHAEYYEVSEACADLLNRTRARGGRIVAVGTTTTRTLETVAQRHDGRFVAESGWTDIFIYPGYRFRAIDALITNFHLPRSTLILLVSAFAGRERILAAYREAIARRYRFFSFGDAMLIL